MNRYFESPPGLQFLHCLENEVQGGHSTFVDSFKAAEILQTEFPEAHDVLSRHRVTFEYQNDARHFYFQRPTIDRQADGDLFVYYAPPFQGRQTFHTPKDIIRFYDAMQKFEQILKRKDLLYSTRLQPGNLVIFANRRVLHGRTRFDGSSGKRHLKGTYVSLDEFRDKVRVLYSSKIKDVF
jgi:gamma-butyrobetaine dioxygenase